MRGRIRAPLTMDLNAEDTLPRLGGLDFTHMAFHGFANAFPQFFNPTLLVFLIFGNNAKSGHLFEIHKLKSIGIYWSEKRRKNTYTQTHPGSREDQHVHIHMWSGKRLTLNISYQCLVKMNHHLEGKLSA